MNNQRLGKRTWLEQRRNYFLRTIISDFLLLTEFYSTLYCDYRERCGKAGKGGLNLPAPDSSAFRNDLFEKLSQMLGSENSKGRLWRLKDTCHQVWPENRQDTTVYGSIVDWLIGSLFHEAMKLKENIYLLNNYSPASSRLGRRPEVGSVKGDSSMPDALLQAIDAQGVFERIAHDVGEQIEGIGVLLGRANYLLRMMLPELADNELVVRLLTEKEDVILELWGESLDSIFSDMFYGDAAGGFCVAGRSYLNGQWYNRAMAMYKRAVSIDAHCLEAVTRLIQLEAVTKDQDCCFGNEAV